MCESRVGVTHTTRVGSGVPREHHRTITGVLGNGRGITASIQYNGDSARLSEARVRGSHLCRGVGRGSDRAESVFLYTGLLGSLSVVLRVLHAQYTSVCSGRETHARVLRLSAVGQQISLVEIRRVGCVLGRIPSILVTSTVGCFGNRHITLD